MWCFIVNIIKGNPALEDSTVEISQTFCARHNCMDNECGENEIDSHVRRVVQQYPEFQAK